jgi:hypothetical protein
LRFHHAADWDGQLREWRSVFGKGSRGS